MPTITPAVRALIHELATPLTVLMSASDILHNRVPSPIAGLVKQVHEISHQFGHDVVELRASLADQIDLHSAITAAGQIRQRAIEWQHGYGALLVPLAHQIQAAAIRMPEPLLDRILNQSLSSGLGELLRVLARLQAIKATDLETS